MFPGTKLILVIASAGFSLFHACAGKAPANPYRSAKERPSDKQRKEEKKQIVKGEKNYKEQMEKNKKDIRKGRDALSMKPQYKSTTKVKKRKKKYGYHF
jgi:hypothetical protein